MVRNIQQAVTCEVYSIAWRQVMTKKKKLKYGPLRSLNYVIYFFLKWVMKNIDKECLCSTSKISSATMQSPTPNSHNVQREHFLESETLGLIRKQIIIYPHQTDGFDEHHAIIINRNHHETLHSLDVVSVLLSVTSGVKNKVISDRVWGWHKQHWNSKYQWVNHW